MATNIDTVKEHDFFVEMLLELHSVNKTLAVRGSSHRDNSADPIGDILRKIRRIIGLQSLALLTDDQEVPLEVFHILGSSKVDNADGASYFSIGKVSN